MLTQLVCGTGLDEYLGAALGYFTGPWVAGFLRRHMCSKSLSRGRHNMDWDISLGQCSHIVTQKVPQMGPDLRRVQVTPGKNTSYLCGVSGIPAFYFPAMQGPFWLNFNPDCWDGE